MAGGECWITYVDRCNTLVNIGLFVLNITVKLINFTILLSRCIEIVILANERDHVACIPAYHTTISVVKFG